MMTLEEAIEHASEKARECGPCAADHAQLAVWLTELKDLRSKHRSSDLRINIEPNFSHKKGKGLIWFERERSGKKEVSKLYSKWSVRSALLRWIDDMFPVQYPAFEVGDIVEITGGSDSDRYDFSEWLCNNYIEDAVEWLDDKENYWLYEVKDVELMKKIIEVAGYHGIHFKKVKS